MSSVLRGSVRRRAFGVGVALSVAGAVAAVVVACGNDEKGTAPSGVDASPDAPPIAPDAGGDSATCAGPRCVDLAMLETCDGTQTPCPLTCSTDGTPHCKTVVPSGAVTQGMLATAGVKDVVLQSTTCDTTSGAIAGLRPANDDSAALEVKEGIGFQVVPIDAAHKIGIWIFGSFTVPAGATVRFTPANAAGFVAVTEARILGTIDVRGYSADGGLCEGENVQGTAIVPGGPGGGAGGNGSIPPRGLGAGGLTLVGDSNAGPGGGGYGALGGRGGAPNKGGGSVGGDGGAPYGTPQLVPLLGGSGGAGVDVSGGGGGGAFQLVAGVKVTIGNGTVTAGINAGGCGGQGGPDGGAGGGGGSGGAVLIETPTFDLQAHGVVAVNGGAGGSGGGPAGPAGGLDGNAATPAFPGNSYGVSGNGGAGTQITGGNGDYASPGALAAGAGGGGVGRIRINSLAGATFAAPQGAILSPFPSAFATSTSFGTAQVR